jgi:nitrogen regulatory protein PII
VYKIEAIVRPDRLNKVQEALIKKGVEEFAITQVHSHGSQPGALGVYRGVTFEVPSADHALVVFHVLDPSLDAAVDAIVEAASTGKPGDGKILVTPLSDVIDIRLGRSTVQESRPPARGHGRCPLTQGASAS